MNLDECLVKLEEIALDEKKKKKPYSSMTITTGDPAYNIAQFNKHAGTDFSSPDGANTPTLDSGYMAGGSEGTSAGASEGAGLTEMMINRYDDFINKIKKDFPELVKNTQEQLDKSENKATDFAILSIFYSKLLTLAYEKWDSEEANEIFADSKAMSPMPESVGKQLCIRLFNIKHLKPLTDLDIYEGFSLIQDFYGDEPTETDFEIFFKDTVKYGEELFGNRLDEDKLFVSKHADKLGVDAEIELPNNVKIIPQNNIEDAIRQISPEDRFEIGYVTPIYFYKELWKQFMLVKCTQFKGYTGIDYRDVRSADEENTADKINARKDNAQIQMAGPDKHIRSQYVNQDYDQINKTVARHDEKKDDKGAVIHGKLNTILFYPDKTNMPKVTYYIDIHNGKGYQVVARDILEQTIFAQVQNAIASGKIKSDDLKKKIEKTLESDYATTGKEVLKDVSKFEYTADRAIIPDQKVMKPQVRALYTNQIYYLNIPSLNIRIGWPLNENLEEAKRYVRRYYIRPQNIFCSNKDEILKALVDHDGQNCTIYTLNNLGDIKDVHRLTNKDIIYYYDEGILYDKNHVKILDYDLSIKNEEERKKYAGEPNFNDIHVKDEYEDRITKATEFEEGLNNELDIDFPELKEDAEKQVCCICGEEFEGFGNNPDPVKEDGRCCDSCNLKFVIPARLKQIKEEK